MKRFLKKTHIFIENENETIEMDTKKKKKNNDPEKKQNSDSSKLVEETSNYSLISLSGTYDDCQVFVFIDKKKYYLIFIKKVCFKNVEAFISDCSCNIVNDSNFLVLNQASQSYEFDDQKMKLIKCDHIEKTIDHIFDRFNAKIGNEKNNQKHLSEFCSWSSEKQCYFNDDLTISATLSNVDGLMLFIFKNQKWKCVRCNWQDAFKCRHGKYLDLPDSETENVFSNDVFSTNIPENETVKSVTPLQLLSKQTFSGNYVLIINIVFRPIFNC